MDWNIRNLCIWYGLLTISLLIIHLHFNLVHPVVRISFLERNFSFTCNYSNNDVLFLFLQRKPLWNVCMIFDLSWRKLHLMFQAYFLKLVSHLFNLRNLVFCRWYIAISCRLLCLSTKITISHCGQSVKIR